jgi:hypothetical protein
VPVTKALKASSVLCENTIAGVNICVFYLYLTFIQHHLHLKANNVKTVLGISKERQIKTNLTQAANFLNMNYLRKGKW